MQNYKDLDNKVHCLDDAKFEYLLPPGCVRITDAEAEVLQTPPDQPAPIPQSLTPRQGMIMLSRAGLLESVKDLLSGMAGQAGVEARIDFEMATEWKRDWPLLLSMSAATGLTSEQVDQMFVDGAVL